MTLKGRTALITGASSGLGWHFAKLLARAGAKVAVAARRVDRLEALAAEIAKGDGRALPVALDVRDPAAVAKAVEIAETELGPLDILVNNAGNADSRPLLDISEEDWRRVIDVDLDGAFRVAQAVARRMVAAGGGGSIINIASIVGLGGGRQLASYAAAKAGLINLTRVMALELARHDIRVNALAPGYIATDLNRDFLASAAGEALKKRVPLRRFGVPEDLDGALLLLAGDAGRWITGSVLTVDGGQTASVI